MAREHKTVILDLERGQGSPSFRAKCSCFFEGIFYSLDEAIQALKAHLSMHTKDGPQPPVPTTAIKVNVGGAGAKAPEPAKPVVATKPPIAPPVPPKPPAPKVEDK
jgi:hypothetical protein